MTTVERGISQRDETPKKVDIPVGPFTLRMKESTFVRWTSELERRVYDSIHVDFVNGAGREIIQRVKRGKLLIAYADHESHYDGRALAKATHILMDSANSVLEPEDRYQGFVLPKATTIDTGHQDSTLQKYSEESMKRNMAQDDYVVTEDYTREKDQKLHHLPSNKIAFLRNMKKHIRSGFGIAVLPEATVQGGRNVNRGKIKPWISINGMQPLEEPTMDLMVRLVRNEGYEPILVPIGIYNTFRIFSPDTLRPPTSTILRAALPFLPKDLVKIKVGLPMSINEIESSLESQGIPLNANSLNAFLGREVSNLIPGRARGLYRQNMETIIRVQQQAYDALKM
jgi:hypothetical protein